MHKQILTLMAALSLIMSAIAAQAANNQQAQAQSYKITDLGPNSFATGINRRGQAVYSSPVSGPVGTSTRAFIYLNGQTQALGTLGGRLSYASGINDHGQVVGDSTTVLPIDQNHAFLWTAGRMQDLGTLGGSVSNANAINNLGVVAGVATASDGSNHAFIYLGGRMLDMNLGKDSVAFGINDFNQVVGMYRGPTTFGERAFLWQNGAAQLLPTLGGEQNIAYDINNFGHVTGWSAILGGVSHAFFYADHKIKDLGILDGSSASYAYAINDRDEVVGYSVNYSVVPVSFSAFLYKHGAMVNLNKFATAGWVLEEAWGINDNGQIVGWGSYNGDPNHAFLLTPVR